MDTRRMYRKRGCTTYILSEREEKNMTGKFVSFEEWFYHLNMDVHGRHPLLGSAPSFVPLLHSLYPLFNHRPESVSSLHSPT